MISNELHPQDVINSSREVPLGGICIFLTFGILINASRAERWSRIIKFCEKSTSKRTGIWNRTQSWRSNEKLWSAAIRESDSWANVQSAFYCIISEWLMLRLGESHFVKRLNILLNKSKVKLMSKSIKIYSKSWEKKISAIYLYTCDFLNHSKNILI